MLDYFYFFEVFVLGDVVFVWIGGDLEIDLFVGQFVDVFVVVQCQLYLQVVVDQVLVDGVVFVVVDLVVCGVFQVVQVDVVVVVGYQYLVVDCQWVDLFEFVFVFWCMGGGKYVIVGFVQCLLVDLVLGEVQDQLVFDLCVFVGGVYGIGVDVVDVIVFGVVVVVYCYVEWYQVFGQQDQGFGVCQGVSVQQGQVVDVVESQMEDGYGGFFVGCNVCCYGRVLVFQWYLMWGV